MRLALLAAMAIPLAAAPLLAKMNLFEELTGGYTLYRIPGIVVTARHTGFRHNRPPAPGHASTCLGSFFGPESPAFD